MPVFSFAGVECIVRWRTATALGWHVLATLLMLGSPPRHRKLPLHSGQSASAPPRVLRHRFVRRSSSPCRSIGCHDRDEALAGARRPQGQGWPTTRMAPLSAQKHRTAGGLGGSVVSSQPPNRRAAVIAAVVRCLRRPTGQGWNWAQSPAAIPHRDHIARRWGWTHASIVNTMPPR
jgi:hypothetical protein